MNLDKKLDLAHEFVMKHCKTDTIGDRDNAVKYAWQYADAMKAEYDKRKTTALPEALLDEFQVDWSIAPDWAVAWSIDSKKPMWWSDVPSIERNMWFIDDVIWQCEEAPSFNYQGDWKDSLRKRPEEKLS